MLLQQQQQQNFFLQQLQQHQQKQMLLKQQAAGSNSLSFPPPPTKPESSDPTSTEADAASAAAPVVKTEGDSQGLGATSGSGLNVPQPPNVAAAGGGSNLAGSMPQVYHAQALLFMFLSGIVVLNGFAAWYCRGYGWHEAQRAAKHHDAAAVYSSGARQFLPHFPIHTILRMCHSPHV